MLRFVGHTKRTPIGIAVDATKLRSSTALSLSRYLCLSSDYQRPSRDTRKNTPSLIGICSSQYSSLIASSVTKDSWSTTSIAGSFLPTQMIFFQIGLLVLESRRPFILE